MPVAVHQKEICTSGQYTCVDMVIAQPGLGVTGIAWHHTSPCLLLCTISAHVAPSVQPVWLHIAVSWSINLFLASTDLHTEQIMTRRP